MIILMFDLTKSEKYVCVLPTAIFSKLVANQADETLDRYFRVSH